MTNKQQSAAQKGWAKRRADMQRQQEADAQAAMIEQSLMAGELTIPEICSMLVTLRSEIRALQEQIWER